MGATIINQKGSFIPENAKMVAYILCSLEMLAHSNAFSVTTQDRAVTVRVSLLYKTLQDEPLLRNRNQMQTSAPWKAEKIALPGHFKMSWVTSHKASSGCLLLF